MLSVAIPVQRYKQVLGALMLSTGSNDIEADVRTVRLELLRIFGVALLVTVALSLYLAGTIARPIRRLAAAAERGRGRRARVEIPDFTRRGDEIGDLSGALREMTDALWQRMSAIERFAADVAHEIKNPLSSLKSAVETVVRIEDPATQRRLMAIILDDVERLDRLITDISDASRLDAELSRLELGPVDIAAMLRALVDVHDATRAKDGPHLVLDLAERSRSLMVPGIETRLSQVFLNLIANAVSFSPPNGEIRLTARHDGRAVLVTVDDHGPGIPDDKLTAIFDRFYSERPAGEKFGTHSGLGLSISKQIVEAHRGMIWAENRNGSGRRRFWRAVLHSTAGAIVTETLLMHATTVAIDGGAILLRGPSGSGKSDLALRLIDGGAQLVADDQTLLQRVGDRVLAAAPPTIAGLIEIRGIGIIKMDTAAPVPLVLIADLVGLHEVAHEVERMPTAELRNRSGRFRAADCAGSVRGFGGGKASAPPTRVGGWPASRYNRGMSTIGSQEPFQFTKGVPGRSVVLVTGMSGAGRSTALKILEDIGYESFDNLPASLIPALIEDVGAEGPAIAVGADARTRGFAAETMLDTLCGVVSRQRARVARAVHRL